MDTVKAYYDGVSFIPIDSCNMPKGTVVEITVVSDNMKELKSAKKLADFQKLTDKVHKTNQEEPLSPEFDEILADSVNFSNEVEL